MDSLTQIVLGASVGEVIVGKKIGNKAPLWGAIAGTIPDLDFLTGNFLSIVQQIEFHRSVSHSIIFCILFSPLLAWLLTKIYKKGTTTFWDWTQLFFWCFLTHAFLDCFTTWGTQLFFPLEYRVAIKSIFVVDPLYTVPFLVLLVLAMFLPKSSEKRRKLNYWGLTISSFYLVLTICNKMYMTQIFEKSFTNQIGSFKNIQTRPTPLNNLLWTANIEVDTGYYLGYYSYLDTDRKISFTYVPKQHNLLEQLPVSEELETLKRISEGFFTIEKEGQNYVFNDLRFGVLGILDVKLDRKENLSSTSNKGHYWSNKYVKQGSTQKEELNINSILRLKNKKDKYFVFSYNLHVDQNKLIISERKKKMKQGKKLMKQVWTRILGQ